MITIDGRRWQEHPKKGDEKMYETIALQKNQNPYGAFELKELYPRNYSLGLTIAAIFHISIIAVYFLAIFLQGGDNNIPFAKKDIKIIEFGAPPPINPTAPQAPISTGLANPSKGIPVPVPESSVSAENTLATQSEMNNDYPVVAEGTENGTLKFAPGKELPAPENYPTPTDFVPCEKLPEIVVRATPVYPELAIRANLEGKVWVNILVDKQGKVKNAIIAKSNQEIFNEAALIAAMQYSFTPALQNNKPVAVWVVVPFKFELRGN